MKKLIPSLVISAATAFCAFAEAQPVKSILDLFQQANVAGKRSDIRSAKLIYSVTAPGMDDAFLLVRGQLGENVRLDVITAKDHYVACRNGENFWGYDKENGAADMSREEMLEMSRDMVFLPLPFFKRAAYKPLTLLANQDDAKRIKYSTAPLDGAQTPIIVSVNAKTRLLARVTTKLEEGTYITSFRDYQNFDGIKIATRIQCSSPDGLVVLTLRSVNWNPAFDQKIFAKSDKVSDGDVVLLKKSVAEIAGFVPAKRTAKVRDAKEEDLRKEISALSIQIKEKEDYLKKLEKLIGTDHQEAVAAAKEGARPHYRYRRTWYYGGWSGRWSTSSREGRYQRKLARRIYKEGVEAAKEYEKVSEELTKLRIRRSDAQIELEKLQKKAARRSEAKKSAEK